SLRRRHLGPTVTSYRATALNVRPHRPRNKRTGGPRSWPIAGSRGRRNLVCSGRSWPSWVPARDQSAWLDGELKLQGLRLALAVDVDIRHLPVGRPAVVRLDSLQAHCDRVGGGAPAGYRAGLEPIAVELAARPCYGAAPVPPGQPPGHGRSAHTDIDDVRALNHPGPAGDVRLHPDRDGSGAGRAGCGWVSALAGRTARSQTAR